MQSDPLNLNNNVYSDQNLLYDIKFTKIDYFFNQIYLFFRNLFTPDTVETTSTVSKQLVVAGDFFKTFLYFLIIFFLTVIAYVIIRMIEVRKKEHEYLHHQIEEYAKKQKEKEQKNTNSNDNARPKNERWEAVLKHLFSTTESDWKLAVIDADEMLFTLMDQLDFKGEGLGDKLKNADRDKFKNLSLAWEVHAIRNRIAHEGTSYVLTQREAKRVIALYEQIFREYGYV